MAAFALIFILEGEEHSLTEATRIVAREGGKLLGIGTYHQTLGGEPDLLSQGHCPKWREDCPCVAERRI